MNRKMSKLTDNYAAVAAAAGLRYDSANNVIYGQRNGYDLCIYAADRNYGYMLSIHTAAKNRSGQALTKDESRELAKSVKAIMSVKQDGNHITVVLSNTPKLEKLKTAVTEAINSTLSFLQARGYEPCCSICGQNVETAGYQAGGGYMHLCPDCEGKMRGNYMASSQEKQRKKENIVGGIIGALIGSLLGVVCIIILNQLGYVAALSGAVMAVGVLKGYELLGGKLTTKGIEISDVVMLLMTYLGDRLDWAIVMHREIGAGYGMNIFECYRLIPTMVESGAIEMNNYLLNLGMIYIFLLLGAVPTIRSRASERKNENRMVKIGTVSSYNTLEQ